ncbi:MAG: hypothetical protein VKM01_01510 [Cyanobacteriota bacterium]|nr:hypothetical protein [Cyanobacteriota bacterium]
MTPLPDRVVVVSLLACIGLVFALVFWSGRLHQPAGDPPLLWRDPPAGGVAL